MSDEGQKVRENLNPKTLHPMLKLLLKKITENKMPRTGGDGCGSRRSSSSSSSSSSSPFGSTRLDARTLLQDPEFLSELLSLDQSMREGSHMSKNDLREMSKVVDQPIGKTDFSDPESVGEMATEALTNLESEVWPNTMEFTKGIGR
eukprot:CAMPEP_0201481998 /NCGR_PEP_ID=MMETSP0151_2-20130828/6255_1 /ASSEMBLY_ACC=CAM_ASM_000257 /TAXON_ID=200890 /ORGANISM="Paramoeba atlantica, Strain 621/1 / CCAP 1560/9" /LENGTH=146 /DNA_ID=CAMNT_0047864451 /DNA_START=53 /DNA_END=490 /DNA_ORIENTATION=+